MSDKKAYDLKMLYIKAQKLVKKYGIEKATYTLKVTVSIIKPGQERTWFLRIVVWYEHENGSSTETDTFFGAGSTPQTALSSFEEECLRKSVYGAGEISVSIPVKKLKKGGRNAGS